MVPRRRRLRRRGARGAERARPVRRHRARRQLHRRPAQVAVRAVRLLRAAVPRPADRARPRTPSTPSTSTCSRSSEEWNASDYAHHLSRRARGLPLWFSLATLRHRRVPRCGRDHARGRPRRRPADPRRAASVELVVEPELSVVVFRRIGWTADQYQAWSDEQLARRSSRSWCPRRGRARPCCATAWSTRTPPSTTSPRSSNRCADDRCALPSDGRTSTVTAWSSAISRARSTSRSRPFGATASRARGRCGSPASAAAGSGSPPTPTASRCDGSVNDGRVLLQPCDVRGRVRARHDAGRGLGGGRGRRRDRRGGRVRAAIAQEVRLAVPTAACVAIGKLRAIRMRRAARSSSARDCPTLSPSVTVRPDAEVDAGFRDA